MEKPRKFLIYPILIPPNRSVTLGLDTLTTMCFTKMRVCRLKVFRLYDDDKVSDPASTILLINPKSRFDFILGRNTLMELGLVSNHGEATITNKKNQKFNLVTDVPAAVPIAVSSPTPEQLPITKDTSVTANAIQSIKIAKTSAIHWRESRKLSNLEKH